MAKQEELTEEKKAGKITAKIVDAQEGMQIYENVVMVRVVSCDHNILIMEDYMPVIGRVTRSVDLVFEDHTLPIAPVQGFYMHKKNEFFLLIDSHKEEERPVYSDEEETKRD